MNHLPKDFSPERGNSIFLCYILSIIYVYETSKGLAMFLTLRKVCTHCFCSLSASLPLLSPFGKTCAFIINTLFSVVFLVMLMLLLLALAYLEFECTKEISWWIWPLYANASSLLSLCLRKWISMYNSSWIQTMHTFLSWMSSYGICGSLGWPDHDEIQSWSMLGSPSVLLWYSIPSFTT